MAIDSAAAFVRGDVREQHADLPAIRGTGQRYMSPEDIEFAELWGRQVGLQMAFRNWPLAHSIVDQGRAAAENQGGVDPYESPLVDIGLEVVDCNLLERHLQVTTVGQVLELSLPELMAIPMFGETRVLNLFARLTSFALKGWANEKALAQKRDG